METTFVHADRETPSQSRAGGSTTATSQLELSRKIATLADLTAQQLRTEWRRLYRSYSPRLKSRFACPHHRLSHAGACLWRPQQSDATETRSADQGIANERGHWSRSRSTRQAGGATCARMAREDTHGRRDGGGFPICRKSLFLAQQDCADHHGCTLVRPPFLRIESR